jgi:oligopeptidase A
VKVLEDRGRLAPDVRFYRIVRQADAHRRRSGRPVLLDLYARRQAPRRGWTMPVRGAGCPAGCRPRWPTHLYFQAPVGEQPATLTHYDVVTLFHEFGHGLHHMLTRVDDLPVSGISGVEWDAVELPSQFMENFCWEWEVLCGMTRHVDSGEPLPRALFDRMVAPRISTAACRRCARSSSRCSTCACMPNTARAPR